MLANVRQVFVAQDRETGCFFDLNVLPVRSLTHAARADCRDIVVDSMRIAMEEGQIECPSGFEVHVFYEGDD
ncbi:MAG: hypothetical protein H6R18_1256 [Proteobacteria bacterium]|nr:hypothetical protein [Pseudomonadota bacterium]